MTKITKNTNAEQIITGRIMSKNEGHGSFSGTVTEAVAKIIEQAQQFGKWVTIGGDMFSFTHNFGKEDETRLQSLLAAAGSFTLSGALYGGTPANVTVELISEPLLKNIKADKSFNPQLICGVYADRGTTKVKTIISNFKSAGVRLQEHTDQIVAGIVGTFKSTTKKARSNGSFNVDVESLPIPFFIGAKTRAQIGVHVRTVKGQDFVKIRISDYNGSVIKIRENIGAVVASILEGLKTGNLA